MCRRQQSPAQPKGAPYAPCRGKQTSHATPNGPQRGFNAVCPLSGSGCEEALQQADGSIVVPDCSGRQDHKPSTGREGHLMTSDLEHVQPCLEPRHPVRPASKAGHKRVLNRATCSVDKPPRTSSAPADPAIAHKRHCSRSGKLVWERRQRHPASPIADGIRIFTTRNVQALQAPRVGLLLRTHHAALSAHALAHLATSQRSAHAHRHRPHGWPVSA